MSDIAAIPDSPAAAGRPGRRPLSRRRILQLGAAMLPGALGARLFGLVGWPGGGSGTARAAVAAGTATVDGAASPGPGAAGGAATPRWAFVVDTTTCLGCGRCVEACKLENNVPDAPELNRTWIELHVVTSDREVFVSSPDGGRHGFPAEEAVPPEAAGSVRSAYFVPRLCMQCENPPCTWVCPVSATYRTADGIVLVDETRCIGCGYCLLACPYGARYMVPATETTPRGVAGVADKCTFCYHRISRGMEPACVEVCPVSARIFGDLDDEASPVSVAIAEKRVRVMKPALGTRPRVFYVGLEDEVE